MYKKLIEHGWKQANAVGLMKTIGPLWAKREENNWVYGLLCDTNHINNAGMVHGGTVTTLSDHVLSILAWETMDRSPCVTLQLDTHFISGCKPGDFIEVRATVNSRTKSTLFLTATLSVSERIVAQSTGIWKMVPQKQHIKE
jgi:acyl-coenzyme A thioesterase PaaI-like protein